MKIKIVILFGFIFFIKNIIGTNTDYPGATYDRDVCVFTLTHLVTGDTVGTTSRGLCYFTTDVGLHIDDGTGSIFFRTPIPIEGSLRLAEGITLYLLSPMILADRVNLTNSGNIQSSATGGLVLTGPLYLNSYWIGGFSSIDLSFYGNGNTIFFHAGGSLRQAGARGLVFKNVKLSGISQESLIFRQNLYLEDTVIDLNSNFCYGGSRSSLLPLKIYGDVLITGTHTFCLDAFCEIYDNAKLIFDIGTTFSMGTNGSITMMNNHTGAIHFNGSNILIGDADFNVDYGRIIFENEVTINDSNSHAHFVIGANSQGLALATARILLEGTTTFSVL